MSTSSIAAFTVSLVLSAAAGCMPQQQAPPAAASASLAPPASASPSPPMVAASSPRLSGDRHVYRFDFVLTTIEGNGSPSNTSFTLNLQDGERGEMVVGKNVALYTAPPAAGPTAAAGPAFVGSPRQDVGMKVLAVFRTQGDDVLLDVNVELSTFDPPSTIRKVVARGNALASPGKPAIVTTLDDDHKRYQLTVTPTKLR